MTPATYSADTLQAATVYDSDGDKVGKVDVVFEDVHSGQPEWVAVKTGMFGGKASFVPLVNAQFEGDALRVPYDKSQIKDAPNFDTSQKLSEQDEDQLYRYYEGIGAVFGGTAGTAGTAGTLDTESGRTGRAGTAGAGTVGHDTSGPNTDNAMTRSEEHLRVGTENVETGRARLRKYIVTEQVTQSVPVSHEEVRIEREPITEANRDAALDGPELSEEEHEVTLHAERPVVQKETVPVERVRLETDQVAEEARVDETVRKEQIEADGTDNAADAYPDDPTGTKMSGKERAKGR
jgi:uncharacterized protein (TIGR02271 family)